MLKVGEAWIRQVEQEYPGFRQTLDAYEARELPACPNCAATNTARVSVGLVGRSLRLAEATTKIKLVPNDGPADCYCPSCGQFFNGPAATKTAE